MMMIIINEKRFADTNMSFAYKVLLMWKQRKILLDKLFSLKPYFNKFDSILDIFEKNNNQQNIYLFVSICLLIEFNK